MFFFFLFSSFGFAEKLFNWDLLNCEIKKNQKLKSKQSFCNPNNTIFTLLYHVFSCIKIIKCLLNEGNRKLVSHLFLCTQIIQTNVVYWKICLEKNKYFGVKNIQTNQFGNCGQWTTWIEHNFQSRFIFYFWLKPLSIFFTQMWYQIYWQNIKNFQNRCFNGESCFRIETLFDITLLNKNCKKSIKYVLNVFGFTIGTNENKTDEPKIKSE